MHIHRALLQNMTSAQPPARNSCQCMESCDVPLPNGKIGTDPPMRPKHGSGAGKNNVENNNCIGPFPQVSVATAQLVGQERSINNVQLMLCNGCVCSELFSSCEHHAAQTVMNRLPFDKMCSCQCCMPFDHVLYLSLTGLSQPLLPRCFHRKLEQ